MNNKYYIKRVFFRLIFLAILSLCFLCSTIYSQNIKRTILDNKITGGLLIHAGASDLSTAIEISENPQFLIQILVQKSGIKHELLKNLKDKKIPGSVSVEHYSGHQLPYVNNMVNVLIIEPGMDISESEIKRVMAPLGLILRKKNSTWQTERIPWPKEIDEWTHFMHDPTGNAVSQDTRIGLPRNLNWCAGPNWTRHHDHMSGLSIAVSAQGRLFYILDEAPRSSIQLPAEWKLICRDAFSGVLLWKKKLPDWFPHIWPCKSGFVQLTRRMAAVGNRVYFTPSSKGPVHELDASIGKPLRIFKGTENTEELMVHGDDLIMLINPEEINFNTYKFNKTHAFGNKKNLEAYQWKGNEQIIVSLNLKTEKMSWRIKSPVMTFTLIADNDNIYFYNGKKIVCHSRKTGKKIWLSPAIGFDKKRLLGIGDTPRLVVYKDVVLFHGRDKKAGNPITAFSIKDGKQIWQQKDYPVSGYASPSDLLIVNGTIVAAETTKKEAKGRIIGYDAITGKINYEFMPDVKHKWFHQRCYPQKATSKYLITARLGTELIDLSKKSWNANNWVRGACMFGVMPANGLLYFPPHSCACFQTAQLTGLNALAPANAGNRRPKGKAAPNRLIKGPAYGKTDPLPSPWKHNWPAYRADMSRSGTTKAVLSTGITPAWKKQLGNNLTPPVAAHGYVFIVDKEQNILYSLNGKNGDIEWSYKTSGRIDSPPTIWKGKVIFGCCNGWIYSLRIKDGKSAWQFRAAPFEEQIYSDGQLESVWPVHGSVLIHDDEVHAVAGRSMFLDGGMRYVRLNVESGKLLSETIMDEKDPVSGKQLQEFQPDATRKNMPCTMNDILSSDEKHIYMRTQVFDFKGKRQSVEPAIGPESQTGEGVHLFSGSGFLDDSWHNRTYWSYGKNIWGGFHFWPNTANIIPSGRIMSVTKDRIFGFARKPVFMCNASAIEYNVFSSGRDFSLNKAKENAKKGHQFKKEKHPKFSGGPSDDWGKRSLYKDYLLAYKYYWRTDIPFHARAFLIAGDVIFLAGYPDVHDETLMQMKPDNTSWKKTAEKQSEVQSKNNSGLLYAISTTDGKVLKKIKIEATPVFDGMIAVDNMIFVSLRNGKLLCLK